MKKFLLTVLAGMFVSNVADIYCRVKFEHWSNTHKRTQGMPETIDLTIMETIARPLDKCIELNEVWFK